MRTAKVFKTGRSQAVRLPAEFRFDTDEVYIHRDPGTGDVILSHKGGWRCWKEYLSQRDLEAVPAEFMAKRNELIDHDRELFGRIE